MFITPAPHRTSTTEPGEVDTKTTTGSHLDHPTPDGDLVALADELRRMGVDSLLLCRPGGRIDHVLSEHQIRRLAQSSPTGSSSPCWHEKLAPA